jgi:dTMP kinase
MLVAPARFITIEGGDGAGKTTQQHSLVTYLGDLGNATEATREPGGTAGADAVRHLLLDTGGSDWDAVAEALLHYAARRAHLVERIWPALAEGRWVVCDRFADSTMAYQGYGLGLARESIALLHQVAVGDFAPDLTLILDLPPEVGLARARRRAAATRYELMDIDFHRRVRDGFLAIAREAPARCVVIDAARPADAVAAQIRAAVQGRLGVGHP